MASELRIGVAEVEITPPLGTYLCGSLTPRPAQAVHDPLMLKALVLESGQDRLVYAVFDVAMIGRELGDRCVALASQRTGIPPERIVWSCTHTHSGPYTDDWFPCRGTPDPANRAWLAGLPEKFAEVVSRADDNKAPARMSRLRAYHSAISHNRRYRYKDGREVNTWLLGQDEEQVQCVGVAGPIDPEIGIVGFDDDAGRLRAVLFHFALHTNAHFGSGFSGDYPAVVAARLREAFGSQVVTLYMPGACGDLNPVMNCRQTGDALADRIVAELSKRKPATRTVAIGVARRDLTVPFRDWRVDQEERIRASQWPGDCQELFRQNLEVIRRRGQTQASTRIHAWRIGEVGCVGLPGELFAEWGLHIKRQSPFPWTYPVELCGDYLGYLVTRQAWDAGGYESLISTVALPSVEGVEMMVEQGMHLLEELWRHGGAQP